MENIFRDLRYGFRRMRRNTTFTLIALLSLALGIGANTAIFSLVEAVLLRDPAIQEPDRVVEIYLSHPDFPYSPFSIPGYREFQRATTNLFSGSYGATFTVVPRDLGDRIESVPIEMVSGDYFSMLGLRPALGRLLGPADNTAPGAHPVVVLSHDYWQSAYGGDRSVIGQSMRISGRDYAIVGVAPREYEGTLRGIAPAIYVPVMMVNQLQPSGYDQLESQGDHGTFVRARLKPGIELPRVTAELNNFYRDMHHKLPNDWPKNGQMNVLPLRDLIVNPMLDRFIVIAASLLTVVVGLVLLIACANLASFLLAQARDRQREIAIRLAIGGDRRGLVQQLLTESVALAFIGGVAGVALAKGLLWLLLNADLPLPLPVTVKATLSVPVLLFALGVSLLAGILFGLAPALQATRTDVISTIKNENTGGGPARRINLRSSLVTAQVAVSLVLLITAGLFLRSMKARQVVDPGFGQAPTALMTFGISSDRYNEQAARLFVQRLETRVLQISGIEAVGTISNLHLNTLNRSTVGVNVDGFTPPAGQDGFTIDHTRVNAGFFEAAGIPIVRGRNFDDAIDLEGAPRVAIVNEVMAERFWPQQDPVGRTFRAEGGAVRIIGVARNAKIRTIGEEPRPFIYHALSQDQTYYLTLLARTRGSAEQAVLQVMTAARDLDPDLMIAESKTMERHLAIMILPARLAAIMFGAFAALALVLSLVGVYGVVSYAVARRTREVGIRLSLGARPVEVIGLLMKDGISMVGIGAIAGLILAFLLAGLLRSVLFGIEPVDPITFSVGSATLIIVGALAAYVPARRVSSVDPARVLKSE